MCTVILYLHQTAKSNCSVPHCTEKYTNVWIVSCTTQKFSKMKKVCYLQWNNGGHICIDLSMLCPCEVILEWYNVLSVVLCLTSRTVCKHCIPTALLHFHTSVQQDIWNVMPNHGKIKQVQPTLDVKTSCGLK